VSVRALIWAEAQDHPELTAAAKGVLVVLAGCHNGRTGATFPSYATIARRAFCCRRTAITAVQLLERLGLVVILRKGNSKRLANSYFLPIARVSSRKGQPSDSDSKFGRTGATAAPVDDSDGKTRFSGRTGATAAPTGARDTPQLVQQLHPNLGIQPCKEPDARETPPAAREGGGASLACGSPATPEPADVVPLEMLRQVLRGTVAALDAGEPPRESGMSEGHTLPSRRSSWVMRPDGTFERTVPQASPSRTRPLTRQELDECDGRPKGRTTP
jgi:Helix-turn-helix domain